MKALRFLSLCLLVISMSCEVVDKLKKDIPDTGETIYPQDTMACTEPYKHFALSNWDMLGTTQGSWGYDAMDLDGNGNNAGGEFPRGSGIYLLFAGGLTIGATKDGTPSVSMTRYAYPEFEPGRIKNTYPVPLDSLRYSDSISGCLYVIDNTMSGHDWTWWPNVYGAPTNPNGTPKLVSDRDSWTIFHDAKASNHGRNGSSPNARLGVEVRQQTYSFNTSGLADAVFIRWNVTNRSTIAYTDLYISLWCDPDMADAANDKVGSDTTLSLLYAYQGNAADSPKAMGIKLLFDGNQGTPIPASMLWSRKSSDEGIADANAFNLLKGLEKDGTARIFGSLTKPQYDFPGDPAPDSSLTMRSVLGINNGLDIRLQISAGPFALGPGETREVVYVVFGSSGTDRLDAITQLKSKTVTITNAFETLVKPDLDLQ